VGPLEAHATSVGEATDDRLSTVVEVHDGTGALVSYATTEVIPL
jgi:hypothetical protein